MLRNFRLSSFTRFVYFCKPSGLFQERLTKKSVICKKFCQRFYSSVYEPDYLKLLEPAYPEYEKLNVQMKGYDFTVVEHFAKYVEKMANHLDLNVSDSWPTPGKKLQIYSYKPGTTVVDREFNLTLYERNVQITNLSTVMTPILIQVIQNSLPAGVKLSIHQHFDEHENERYIPDLELRDLRKELDELLNPKTS